MPLMWLNMLLLHWQIGQTQVEARVLYEMLDHGSTSEAASIELTFWAVLLSVSPEQHGNLIGYSTGEFPGHFFQ